MKPKILNPTRISQQEQDFLNDYSGSKKIESCSKEKEKFKGRMVSMPETFFDELNEYLRLNPREGSRSSFIVRIVSEYIEERKKKL